MIKKSHKWQPLTQAYNPGLKEVLFQQYYGAQFVAMAGSHLITQRDDDSNTSMVFDPDLQSLKGETLQENLRLQLRLSDLTLSLLRKDSVISPAIPLSGLNRNEVFNRLSHILINVGINIDNLNNTLHYELPNHDLLDGSLFEYDNPLLIQENIAYRHNAEIVLNHAISSFPDAETVRIWPHHFDTGTIIPLNWDKSGELIRSVGLGWAIPDTMVNEPYFYLSIWSKDPLKIPTRLPSLEAGHWMMPGWNGAVLNLSEILSQSSAEEQLDCANSFFKSGLRIVRELINS